MAQAAGSTADAVNSTHGVVRARDHLAEDLQALVRVPLRVRLTLAASRLPVARSAPFRAPRATVTGDHGSQPRSRR